MKWIKTSERLPKVGKRVLLLLEGFQYDDEPYEYKVAYAQRIKKEHVPLQVLKDNMEQDKDNNFDYFERRGWVPGACYQFEETDHISLLSHTYYYDKKCDTLHKFLLKEVAYWHQIPKLPEVEEE